MEVDKAREDLVKIVRQCGPTAAADAISKLRDLGHGIDPSYTAVRIETDVGRLRFDGDVIVCEDREQ